MMSLKDDLWLVVHLAWSVGWIVAVPAVLFGFGGAYLDKAWGTSPWLLLGGFVLAMSISGVGVYRKVKEIL